MLSLRSSRAYRVQLLLLAQHAGLVHLGLGSEGEQAIAADALLILEFSFVSRLRLLEMVEPRYVKSSTTFANGDGRS